MKLNTLYTKIDSIDSIHNFPSTYIIKDNRTDEVIDNIKLQVGEQQDTGVNGITIEDLLLICVNQVDRLQDSDFATIDGERLFISLKDSLDIIRSLQYTKVVDEMVEGLQDKLKVAGGAQ